jgi:magnesium chelatase family protein
MIIDVQSPRVSDMFREGGQEDTETVKKRILSRNLHTSLELDQPCKDLLHTAVDRLGLNVKTVSSIVRVSRTIANLDYSEHIKAHHIAEAIQYRASQNVIGG